MQINTFFIVVVGFFRIYVGVLHLSLLMVKQHFGRLDRPRLSMF